MIKKYCILTKNRNNDFETNETFNTLADTLYHIYKYLKYECTDDFEDSFFQHLNIDFNRENPNYFYFNFEETRFANPELVLVMTYLLLEYMNNHEYDKEQIKNKKREIISKCVDNPKWSSQPTTIQMNGKSPRMFYSIINQMKQEMLKFLNRNSPNYIIGSFYEKE